MTTTKSPKMFPYCLVRKQAIKTIEVRGRRETAEGGDVTRVLLLMAVNKLFPSFSLDSKINLHLLLLSHFTPMHTYYIVNKFISPCKLHFLVTDELSFRTCLKSVPYCHDVSVFFILDL